MSKVINLCRTITIIHQNKPATVSSIGVSAAVHVGASIQVSMLSILLYATHKKKYFLDQITLDLIYKEVNLSLLVGIVPSSRPLSPLKPGTARPTLYFSVMIPITYHQILKKWLSNKLDFFSFKFLIFIKSFSTKLICQ